MQLQGFSQKNKKYDHITPVLRSLHWLPLCKRVEFKIILLVYKTLNGLGPKYLLDLLTPYQPSRTLRSSGKGLLTVYRPKTKHGKASFKYFASYSWNKLPETLRCAPNVATFKSRLKTFLFYRAYEHWFASLICLLQEYLSKLWVVAPIFHMIMFFQYTYFLIFYFYYLLFTFTLLLFFILLF